MVFRLDSGIRQEFEKEWLWTDASTGAKEKSLALEVKPVQLSKMQKRNYKAIDFENGVYVTNGLAS